MKPIVEIIAQKVDQSFSCKVRRQLTFDIGWHVHPELQMSLMLEGRGYRILGDNITPLQPGDLVLVGANVPHCWHHDPIGKKRREEIHFITINFREDFLGEVFLNLPEMKPVLSLFTRAKRGLLIQGDTRAKIAERMYSIAGGNGLHRIIDLLGILDLLVNSHELEPIATAGFMPEVNLVDEQRLNLVCSHIIHHLDEEIHREELARLVNLSPISFSRYFKTRTGKTLPDFINELRVGRACRLLGEEDQPITDIALACGFPNLSHFHRQFRRRIGLSPREYRNVVNQSE
jgi:AraC-like DNA-binding protein